MFLNRPHHPVRMILRALSLVAIWSSSLSFADGLFINDEGTRYEGPHHLVQINADQVEELTVAGTLTLTREQWQNARKHEPSTPKRIETVIPSTSKDCYCSSMDGLVFGIWFKNNTVAIVSLLEKTPFAQLDENQKSEIATNIQLKMDARGEFYESATWVPYEDVKTRVRYTSPQSEGTSMSIPSLIIDIPPASNASDPALVGRLTELQALAKATNRIFSIQWDRIGTSPDE